MTTTTAITQAYEQLKGAIKDHISIQALTEANPDFTVEEAYQVQLKLIADELEAGRSVTGKKIGLTSLAMQNLLGVDQPDYGQLLNNMAVENNGTIETATLFQPKVEGEIAFILKEDLVGPNVTEEQVLAATAFVVPSLEIVDSRIKDWQIKLADTVADNASCGLYVLGNQQTEVESLDLTKVTMRLLQNGSVINEGSGADVLGHPATCVAWLANKLFEYGVTLKKGEIILSGALTAAVVAKPGDTFTAEFSDIGSVSVKFT
ncbi:2-keto-4-pentenoate hydratase [Rummeliibacillus sp. JY-2-4R]